MRRDSIYAEVCIDHKQTGVLFGTSLCAAGLLSLFYHNFVSRGKTSLAGDMPVGLTGECLCHTEALYAGELIVWQGNTPKCWETKYCSVSRQQVSHFLSLFSSIVCVNSGQLSVNDLMSSLFIFIHSFCTSYSCKSAECILS